MVLIDSRIYTISRDAMQVLKISLAEGIKKVVEDIEIFIKVVNESDNIRRIIT
ncbi:hypothetical protein AGMMS50222_07030 [Endomicrobiia bacterium]|nr:hypothetical protein AGMMS49531_07060 [Endomicrobiia bacterium]GHT66203.1 hypothetical protein AGMMS49556_06920 [Endomicrobiia bacterium]GHT70771.1 hypothetical protein AGMMS49950_06300 [Endomicrobiia bacterium]GHT75656.1 hypothetical protein AGMMS50222_07030 [Endomicrobiia bacterium]